VALADDLEDPREVAWHPRFAVATKGHDQARSAFLAAFKSGKPHHAWLLTGPSGIGKATLAYELARHVFSATMSEAQVKRWVHARAHPDLVVLERSFNDAKPKKLKGEISVDDVRKFNDFFARTSSNGGWRVGLVDCADDLNSESANALLKLVEEPPSKALILLVCHTPGRLLRTLRSRCRKLALSTLTNQLTAEVLTGLPLEPAINSKELLGAAEVSRGRPGFALQLLQSEGAKAFQAFAQAKRLDAAQRHAIGQYFAVRGTAPRDYEVFMGLLLDWLAIRASSTQHVALADLHSQLAEQQAVVSGYNLDRRISIMESLALVDHALKAA
jgi:DNA polymerase III subunit delta'